MANTYTTEQGDMWDGISFKVYQSEYYMTDLIEANPQYRETVIFPANVVLVIPEVSPPVPRNLPPWKRVNS
ncbi:MAG: phage tail protein [Desulfosporosinus sp. BRH_c37]|nr:MAG: phage tail protein [Desulfosporosinus sp. BRH_c37]